MVEEMRVCQKETQEYTDESNTQTAGDPGKENESM